MKMFLITFIAMTAFILLMGIGVILVGKKLKGSCGGLGVIMGEDCMFCSKAEECKKRKEQEALLAESYED
jgi:uncharacterized protein